MKTINEQGCWIMITKIIMTIVPVHMFGIYYAKPTGKLIEGEQQVKILTDQGEVLIQPNEFNVITYDQFKEYVDDEDSTVLTYLDLTKKPNYYNWQEPDRNVYIYLHPGYIDYFTRSRKVIEYYFIKQLYAMRGKHADRYLDQIKSLGKYNYMMPQLEEIIYVYNEDLIQSALDDLMGIYEVD